MDHQKEDRKNPEISLKNVKLDFMVCEIIIQSSEVFQMTSQRVLSNSHAISGIYWTLLEAAHQAQITTFLFSRLG